MKTLATTTILLLLPILFFSQEIDIELFASGFNNPTGIKHAGDDRLFITEQSGAIKIINADGSVNPTPFIDLNSIVINTGNERGLLGLAFHPQYSSNGFFFVNYINNSGNTVVSRFVADPPNGNTANINTEEILMTINQPYSNHNGGDLAFGNDGYLYIALGDGGSGGDPEDRSQNLTTYLGKLLRINVNSAEGGNNYAIPTDNPFFGSPSFLPEIWAYGLRNPWRFSFDSLTNDLWIADVGQNNIEEINFVGATASGVNYGWRCYEGNAVYNTSGNCPDISTLTFPVAQYTHTGSGAFKCSITGGYRYRGTAQPTFDGLYFFADYCSDEIGTLSFNGSAWEMNFSQVFSGNGWTAFGENIDGEIYITGRDSGNVFRIIDANLSVDENKLNTVKMYPNPAEDILVFDASNAEVVISSISIFDLQGKLIKTFPNINDRLFQVSTKGISSGLYLTEILSSNNGKVIKKLIVK